MRGYRRCYGQAVAREVTRAVSDAMALRLVSSTHEPVAAVGRGIRRYVRILLENWGLGAESVEDALVVVEELVANVVTHARTRFALVIQLSSKILRIAVTTSALP